jgi:hypothetical protein
MAYSALRYSAWLQASGWTGDGRAVEGAYLLRQQPDGPALASAHLTSSSALVAWPSDA